MSMDKWATSKSTQISTKLWVKLLLLLENVLNVLGLFPQTPVYHVGSLSYQMKYSHTKSSEETILRVQCMQHCLSGSRDACGCGF